MDIFSLLFRPSYTYLVPHHIVTIQNQFNLIFFLLFDHLIILLLYY